MKDKIRILVWGDSPAVNTGFGVVVRGIFKRLGQSGDYDIDIIGINDPGGYKDPEEFPNMRIYPAVRAGERTRDFHGRGRFVEAVLGADDQIKGPWDIVFTINDPQVLDMKIHQGMGTMQALLHTQLKTILKDDPEEWFKIVSYFPVDSKLRPNWVVDTVALPDYIVPYTQYAQDEILEANMRAKENMVKNIDERMRVIYHGYDSEAFYPIDTDEKLEFKKEFFNYERFGINDETFIVSIVGRNQMRKDIPRAMKVFAEFKKRRPDSFLYINAKNNDVWGNFKEYAFELGLEVNKDFTFPGAFNERYGLPEDILNNIYNVSDVLLTANHGEGFGLSTIEAMATKTINLAPLHTVNYELFNLEDSDVSTDARGVGYKSGSNLTDWVFMGPQDMHRQRPLANVEDGVAKLTWIYDNPEEAEKIVENAYEWVQDYTWDKVAADWDKLFQEAVQSLKEDRDNAEQIKSETMDKIKKEMGAKKV